MTKEEAIKILSPNSESTLVRAVDGFLPTQNVLCALEMAISALRAQQEAEKNAPLTLEELREMDGEPVWVVSIDGRNSPCWMLVDVEYDLCREAHGGMAVFENNGFTWLAYRRKPEGGDGNA